MSSNIPRILSSLTKIIIRYHDIRTAPKIVADPSPESLNLKAKDIISKPVDNIKTTLQLYIDECTKGYLERKPFLNYIVYHIEYLKPITENKLFNAEDIENIFNHLYQLIVDVQGLLNTTKGTNYKVTQDGHEIHLNGLARSGYYALARPLCDSGEIALEELLSGLNLKLTSTNEEITSKIRDIVDRISLESQVAKLSTENQALKAQLVAKDQIIHNLARGQASRNGNAPANIPPNQSVAAATRGFALLPSSFPFSLSFFPHPPNDQLNGVKTDDEVLDFGHDLV